jgi:hypothetical protein
LIILSIEEYESRKVKKVSNGAQHRGYCIYHKRNKCKEKKHIKVTQQGKSSSSYIGTGFVVCVLDNSKQRK